jgi:hypothetical protein
MRRKLLLIMVVASFAFAFVIAVLWIRALTAGDKWFVQHVVPGKSLGVSHIEFTSKELAINNSWRPEFPGTTADQLAWEVDEAGWEVQHSRTSDDIFYPGLRGLGRAGFAWHRQATLFADRAGKVVGAETFTGLLIPLWALLMSSLVPLMFVVCAFLIRRSIGRRRQRSGRCEGCGYDLRGSTVRCPECGRAMTSLVPPTTAA